MQEKTEIKKRHEFEFVIDDRNIYHYAADFRSPQAKAQFRNYLQLKESYNQQQNKLENMRTQYSRANQNERSKMAPAILDLEKRVLQLANEVDRTAIQVRKLEKQTIMDIFIIAILVVAAVILFLVELFIIPGISIAGFLAGGCIIYANYYAFANLGATAGFITLAISVITCVGSLVWFMHSKTLDKIALKKNITSKVDRSAEEKVKIGDTGITTTRLALIGYAEINGDIVEVKSTDGFLNEKTPIIVNRITDGVILVEKNKP